jgi:hypothetical protein
VSIAHLQQRATAGMGYFVEKFQPPNEDEAENEDDNDDNDDNNDDDNGYDACFCCCFYCHFNCFCCWARPLSTILFLETLASP